jgi:hypothetical protein
MPPEKTYNLEMAYILVIDKTIQYLLHISLVSWIRFAIVIVTNILSAA